jgi:hypothetical protein
VVLYPLSVENPASGWSHGRARAVWGLGNLRRYVFSGLAVVSALQGGWIGLATPRRLHQPSSMADRDAESFAESSLGFEAVIRRVR